MKTACEKRLYYYCNVFAVPGEVGCDYREKGGRFQCKHYRGFGCENPEAWPENQPENQPVEEDGER